MSNQSTAKTAIRQDQGNDGPQQQTPSQQQQLDLGSSHQLSDKKSLRKQIGSLLSTLSDDEIESQCRSFSSPYIYVAISNPEADSFSHKAVKAGNLLLSLPEYKNARTISIFMSMPGGEINTGSVLKDALTSGKQVFIPYIYKPKELVTKDLPVSIMDMLCLSSEEDRASLKPDRWGIPSLPKESVESRANCFGGQGLRNGGSPKEDAPGLDVIVMPSMAFDGEMNRLGHGKGYYDNFITRYCATEDNNVSKGRKKPFLGMSFACFFLQFLKTQY